MIKRTRKWAHLAQEARRLAALGMSVREIAKHLDVSPTTITAWRKSGKLPRLVVDNTPQPASPVSGEMTPDEWAKQMRSEFRLSASDDIQVTHGVIAATIARDPNSKRSEVLNALRTFKSIDQGLQLVIRNMRAAEAMQQQPAAVAVNAPGPVAVPKRPRARRRSTTDPRLAVIK